MKPNCHDRLDWVRYMIKTRQDNNVLNRTCAIYAKNKIELSWPIGLSAVYVEKRTRQQRDRLYICGLHWKMKLNYCDWSHRVWSVTKTKQDYDVINPTSAVYVKNEIKLLWLIKPCAVCEENKIGQRHDLLYRCGLPRKRNWTVVIDRTWCVMWQKLDITMTLPII